MSRQLLILLVVALHCFGPCLGATCSDGQCRISEGCSRTQDCMTGLVCSGNCTSSPICLTARATDVLALNQSLPFNKYAWLTTHNAFAIENSPMVDGVPRLTFENQEDSVTDQLNNGVRGLMLDMYDYKNDVWLCHSLGGQCQNYTAFRPAIDTLKEIASFLSANPSAIITIFIEDYVRANKGLTNVFTAAGLMKYFFPLSRMPKDGSDWPTVSDMISQNQRLLVFTSIASKEASEGIAYQWNYVLENQYGDGGMQGTCSNRPESPPLNTKTRSLILVNYFPTNPDQARACQVNAKGPAQVIGICNTSSGNRYANFLAVDFYKRSTGGGSFQAVDMLNGKLMCGCSDVHACQANLAQGVCNTTNIPQVVAPPPPSSGPPPSPSTGSSSSSPNRFSYGLQLAMTSLVLLFAASSSSA